MCVLLHLFICAALRAHVIVAEALYKVNYYYYYYYYYYCYHHSSSSLLYKFLNSIAPVYLTELNPDSLQTNPPAIPLFWYSRSLFSPFPREPRRHQEQRGEAGLSHRESWTIICGSRRVQEEGGGAGPSREPRERLRAERWCLRTLKRAQERSRAEKWCWTFKRAQRRDQEEGCGSALA